MQVTETHVEGLKRGFRVTLPAADLASKLDAQIEDLKGRVQLNGFRPGKVPAAHIRKLYGPSVMNDVIQEAVTAANKSITDERGLRLALQPRIEMAGSDDEKLAVLEGKADLVYSIELEVLPEFEIKDFAGLTLTRPVADVEEDKVKASLEQLAKRNRTFQARPADVGAEIGDRLMIDFVGTIDGQAFEGGKSADIEVVLGEASFIPGFEEGLFGAVAGEKRAIKARFPVAYARQELADKDAEFEVTVKFVGIPDPLAIDDALATSLGLESLTALEEALRANLGADLARVSRAKLKRQLLDKLDQDYDFDLPPGMVLQEFDNVWRQLTGEMKSTGRTFEDESTTEDKARAEYQAIATRRVRLGLVIAKIGDRAEVKIDEKEVTAALVERARQFPGQEKQVWEFYRKNPEALADLRAPIFEDKVVDHILAAATVTDEKVTVERLMSEDEAAAPAAPAAPAA